MVTMVGKQTNFSKALQELLELDYDAIEAYETAIIRLHSDELISALNEFKMDHQNHVEEISKILRTHNADVPTKPSAKQWLTKGKIYLGSLMGDKAIFLAMLTNEEDTNEAYLRMLHRTDIWQDAMVFLKKGYEDEKRHKNWIEAVIKKI